MAHTPDVEITEEGKVIDEDYKEMYQASIHIAKYQKAWIKQQREDESKKFNLSATMRKGIDKIIEQSEVGLPEEALITEEQFKEDNKLAVYFSED
jgi:hypothetical protein